MNDKFQTVFVTGGAGCIGMQVCNELISRGISVHLFDLPEQIARVKKYIPKSTNIFYGSILDCSSLRDAIAGCDAIVHLAAYLGVRRTETNRLRCIDININGTKNILECAVQNRVKKIVFVFHRIFPHVMFCLHLLTFHFYLVLRPIHLNLNLLMKSTALWTKTLL